MKSLITQLFRWLFPEKKNRSRLMPAVIIPVPQQVLSDEDWSDKDCIFDNPISSRRTIIRTRGKVHNIKKIFTRLNNEHFDGKIKAKITYARYGCRNVKRRTSITFGTYSSSELLIRIHPALDSKEVPEYVVEHVIHHEMLHEVLRPIQGSGYHRVVHHYDFRVAEAATSTYEDAMKWERENSARIFYAEPKKRKGS